MSKAIVFLADGTEECEALITVDLLKRAGVETVTASVMGRAETVSSHNIPIKADMLAEEADYDSADAIVLPGGLPGTYNIEANETVIKQIKKYNEEGKCVAAICAAPSVFARLGMLEGKTATVNPGFEEACSMAKLTYGKAARDGNIITGQAVGGAFEFALEIIKVLCGEEKAKEVKEQICY